MEQQTLIEQVILGSILMDEKLVTYLNILHPKMFKSNMHREILIDMLEVLNKGFSIDLLTLGQQGRNNGANQRYGGISYLSELTNVVASTATFEQNLLFLKDSWMKSEISTLVSHSIINNEYSGLELAENIKTELDKLEQEFREGFTYKYQNQSDLYTETIEYINEAKSNHESGIEPHGKKSNVKELDELIGNFQNGELTIIGARPSMGKTMLMLQIALNKTKLPVLIFSLEMSNRSLMIRQISREVEVEYRELQSGRFKMKINELIEKTEWLRENKIIIDDTSNMSCSQMERVVSDIHKKHGGIACVMVDYLDIVENGEKEIRLKVSKTARTLKRIAKDFNTAVICLAQLSRELSKRADKRPILSDIRESGKIEEEADMIIFLHRPEYYEENPMDEYGNSLKGVLEMIVAKNRNGSLGTAKSNIDLRYGKFIEQQYQYKQLTKEEFGHAF